MDGLNDSNISHWLLTTHAVALFPMGVFLWN